MSEFDGCFLISSFIIIFATSNVYKLFTLFSFLVVVVPFAVFAMFRHRPTGPVTIHARDITIRQEARIKIE